MAAKTVQAAARDPQHSVRLCLRSRSLRTWERHAASSGSIAWTTTPCQRSGGAHAPASSGTARIDDAFIPPALAPPATRQFSDQALEQASTALIGMGFGRQAVTQYLNGLSRRRRPEVGDLIDDAIAALTSMREEPSAGAAEGAAAEQPCGAAEAEGTSSLIRRRWQRAAATAKAAIRFRKTLRCELCSDENHLVMPRMGAPVKTSRGKLWPVLAIMPVLILAASVLASSRVSSLIVSSMPSGQLMVAATTALLALTLLAIKLWKLVVGTEEARCNHAFCRECFHHYLVTQIRDRQVLMAPCPMDPRGELSCPCVTRAEFVANCTPEELRRYQRVADAEGDPTRCNCSMPNCEGLCRSWVRTPSYGTRAVAAGALLAICCGATAVGAALPWWVPQEHLIDYQPLVSSPTLKSAAGGVAALGSLLALFKLGWFVRLWPPTSRRSSCSECRRDTCFDCKEPWHGGSSCGDAGLRMLISALGARFCLCTRCNAPCERYEGCNHVSRHRGLAAAHFILCSQPTPVGLTSVCCCPRADVLPSSGRVRSPLLLPLRLCPRWWALSRREVGSLPIVRWPTPRHCCCHG